jgi:hypothetical protein
VAIGLPLVQEGIIDAAAVKYLLLKALGVSSSLVDAVWEFLAQHYSDSQYRLSLKAYTKRVVEDLRPLHGDGVFRDQSGAEYWIVRRAAQELNKDKATISRWIKSGVLSAKEFSYQGRSGVKKTVLAVARSAIERVTETTNLFDEPLITLLCQAHQISRSSAERQYRRICQRLGCKANAPIKSDREKAAIMAVLRADPKIVGLGAQQPGRGPVDEPEVEEDAMEEPVWADIHEGHLHLSEAP